MLRTIVAVCSKKYIFSAFLHQMHRNNELLISIIFSQVDLKMLEAVVDDLKALFDSSFGAEP